MDAHPRVLVSVWSEESHAKTNRAIVIYLTIPHISYKIHVYGLAPAVPADRAPVSGRTKGVTMPVKKLMEFLDGNKVKYVIMKHSPAYTAQEVASSAHIKGKELAKTVMIKIDGTIAMAVLPASYRIDMDALKKAAKAKKIELATEKEFRDLFPECETGAMPPFGNLYDMDVYVASSLEDDENIAFNAGTHTELIQLPYEDFKKLAEPKVVEFSIKE